MCFPEVIIVSGDTLGDLKDKIWHRSSSDQSLKNFSDAFLIFRNIHPLQPNQRQMT